MNTQLKKLLKDGLGHVYCVPPTMRSSDAIQVMCDEGVGEVGVHNGKQLLGIFTERDIVHWIVGRGKRPSEVTVAGVMTTPVHSLSPDATIADAFQLLEARQIRRVVVCDGAELVGIISLSELCGWVARELDSQIDSLNSYIHGVPVSPSHSRQLNWAASRNRRRCRTV